MELSRGVKRLTGHRASACLSVTLGCARRLASKSSSAIVASPTSSRTPSVAPPARVMTPTTFPRSNVAVVSVQQSHSPRTFRCHLVSAVLTYLQMLGWQEPGLALTQGACGVSQLWFFRVWRSLPLYPSSEASPTHVRGHVGHDRFQRQKPLARRWLAALRLLHGRRVRHSYFFG